MSFSSAISSAVSAVKRGLSDLGELFSSRVAIQRTDSTLSTDALFAHHSQNSQYVTLHSTSAASASIMNASQQGPSGFLAGMKARIMRMFSTPTEDYELRTVYGGSAPGSATTLYRTEGWVQGGVTHNALPPSATDAPVHGASATASPSGRSKTIKKTLKWVGLLLGAVAGGLLLGYGIPFITNRITSSDTDDGKTPDPSPATPPLTSPSPLNPLLLSTSTTVPMTQTLAFLK